MSRRRNVLAVPLTDEQAALLERVCADKFDGEVSKADLARYAVFSLYLPKLGYESVAPMPRPQSERTPSPRKERKHARKEATQPPVPMTELQRQASADEGHHVPGKTRVVEAERPKGKRIFRDSRTGEWDTPVPAKKLGGEPPVPASNTGWDTPVDDRPVWTPQRTTRLESQHLGEFVDQLNTKFGRQS